MGAGRRDERKLQGRQKPHRGRSQPAQALIELALILPILMVLIVGALEFGRLWSSKIVLTNAAREGAYYLTTHESDYKDCAPDCFAGTKAAAINEAANSGVNMGSTDVVITTPCCTPGLAAEVTTNTTVKDLLILGFVGNVFHLSGSVNDFHLSSSVQMMVQ